MLTFNYFNKKSAPPPLKKNLIIFGNCHFQDIQRNIIQYQYVKKHYNPYYISINSYVDKPHGKKASLFDQTYFTNEHVELFKKADILIYQNIETDRGFLNNKEVRKLIKPNCIKIKIPHYRSSIYHYSWYEEPYFDKLKEEVNKITAIKEKIQYIKKYIADINNKKYDTKKLNEFIDKQLIDFKKVDSYSNISMYDYFINNYKKIQLINGRSYPSSYFIFILSKKILEKLDIHQNLSFYKMIQNKTTYPRYFSQHTNYPLFDYWYKYNNFTFKNQYYWDLEVQMKDYEFYYLQIKIYNTFGKERSFDNVIFIRSEFNGLEEVKKLRNLIKL